MAASTAGFKNSLINDKKLVKHEKHVNIIHTK